MLQFIHFLSLSFTYKILHRINSKQLERITSFMCRVKRFFLICCFCKLFELFVYSCWCLHCCHWWCLEVCDIWHASAGAVVWLIAPAAQCFKLFHEVVNVCSFDSAVSRPTLLPSGQHMQPWFLCSLFKRLTWCQFSLMVWKTDKAMDVSDRNWTTDAAAEGIYANCSSTTCWWESQDTFIAPHFFSLFFSQTDVQLYNNLH